MSPCEQAREQLFSPGAASPEARAHLAACPDCARLAAAAPAVDAALARLAAEPAPAPPPWAALAPAAEGLARARRARAWRRRALPLALAAGLAALVATGSTLLATRGAPAIAPGDTLSAAQGHRAARLPSRAELELERGQVSLLGAEPGAERLRLEAGAVTLSAPRRPGARLAVQTRDAEVVVEQGRVQVAAEADFTEVVVLEGEVEVRAAGRPVRRLHRGETLRVAPLAAWLREKRDAAVAALEAGDLDAAERALSELFGAEPGPAQAAEADALLAWVHRARGQAAQAVELYRRALAALPEGPAPTWAEDACAELALLEEQAGRGPGAWGECLRRFPEGAHAALARLRLAAERPGGAGAPR